MTTGEYIKARRVQIGMTQQQLGELVGYTGRTAESMVQQWERGARPVPQKKMKPLAEILNVPVVSLLP